MSIQYLLLGFELVTFGTWVYSHNHQTRASAQGQLLDLGNCNVVKIPFGVEEDL